MLKIDYNAAQELQVSLFTSSGSAITGAAHGDVTCYYKKEGASSWTTKTLDSGNWREDGSGLYYVTFDSTDTDTYGTFVYRVVHANGYFTGHATITDWASEATQLQNIYDLLATKVNKEALLERERALDNQLTRLIKMADELDNAYTELITDIAYLKNRIASL